MTTQTPNLAARLDALPITRWHVWMAIICYLGLLFDAFDLNILAAVLPQLVQEWHLTNVQTGVMASAGFIGMFIGALLFGTVADMIGRWRSFQITILVYALGTGLMALSPNFGILFAMRVVAGLGLGGVVPVDASYLTEYMPSSIRGRIMSWFNAMFGIGISSAMVSSLYVAVPFGWRWGFALGVLPAILVVVIQRKLPESTRYLLQKGRTEEAVRIVEKIEEETVKKVTVPTALAVQIEQTSIGIRKTRKVPITGLFVPGILRITIVTSILWFTLQFAVYSLSSWMPILLTRELQIPLTTALGFLAIVGLTGVLGQFSAGFACDFLGRRITLAYSYILCGLLVLLLFLLRGANLSLAFMVLLLWYISVGSSNGALYAYTSESFPTEVRGAGSGFAGAIGRLSSIIGPTLVGLMYASNFSILTMASINMVLLLIGVSSLLFSRETKKKTLEDIARAIHGSQ